MGYQSPFSWRYGSDQMREIFSREATYRSWRRVWMALATAQHQAGLITVKELEDLQTHQDTLDPSEIDRIEQETKHDVFAALKEFAAQAPIGGGKLHLGATSMDITDTAEAIRLRQASDLIQSQVSTLLKLFSQKIQDYADTPCMGYTHLQPAEPTTIGYRFAFYAQDLLLGLRQLRQATDEIKAKGFKGAVGTSASYTDLLADSDQTPADLENAAMQELEIDAALITSQVVSKQAEALLLQVLAMISAACAKFAADLRILQSPLFGEWSEPFDTKQVGSSAMPFKRNPIAAEKICSLARYVVQLPAIPLENVMHSYLDRTLDDSANRRIVTAEAYLAVDEILKTTTKLVDQMQIDLQAVRQNLDRFVPFAASEQILMAACKNGADRQQLHEVLKQIALSAWEQLKTNPQDKATTTEPAHPMIEQIRQSETITQYLSQEEISTCFAHAVQVGDAPDRARRLIKLIDHTISNTSSQSQS